MLKTFEFMVFKFWAKQLEANFLFHPESRIFAQLF